MSELENLYIEQSAVIPYRKREGEIEILLITSRRRKRWIIPKGIIEPELTPQESAAQEALEEAGVRGDVSPILLGVYNYNKWGGICRVQVFLLEVKEIESEWLEASFRDREWVSLSEAIERIQEVEIKEILRQLRSVLVL
jgi:8-oxo-dGTP pyrophosphatase MutT (NUDIX family)